MYVYIVLLFNENNTKKAIVKIKAYTALQYKTVIRFKGH